MVSSNFQSFLLISGPWLSSGQTANHLKQRLSPTGFWVVGGAFRRSCSLPTSPFLLSALPPPPSSSSQSLLLSLTQLSPSLSLGQFLLSLVLHGVGDPGPASLLAVFETNLLVGARAEWSAIFLGLPRGVCVCELMLWSCSWGDVPPGAGLGRSLCPHVSPLPLGMCCVVPCPLMGLPRLPAWTACPVGAPLSLCLVCMGLTQGPLGGGLQGRGHASLLHPGPYDA